MNHYEKYEMMLSLFRVERWRPVQVKRQTAGIKWSADGILQNDNDLKRLHRDQILLPSDANVLTISFTDTFSR